MGNWGSGSIANMGDWLVNGEAGLLDDWGLNNMVDWVDLVGLRNSNWVWDLNGVGLGNVGLVDNLALDWDGDWNWDLNGDLVHLKLGLDAGNLRGDLGVGANWSDDLLLNKIEMIF